MTDTIMLEAPARGGRISDLADGQGRILRLHDLTASSLGHTSHANQTESPTRTGGRGAIERKPDEGDGPAVIHRLNDERDQRWQNLIAGFLIHASRGIVRHDGQHEYTAVPDGPWRTSAPYASSLSGAADNRWGGRDKRKDIHRNLTSGPLYIESGNEPVEVECTPRINIDYAENGRTFPWRFVLKGSPWVSR